MEEKKGGKEKGEEVSINERKEVDLFFICIFLLFPFLPPPFPIKHTKFLNFSFLPAKHIINLFTLSLIKEDKKFAFSHVMPITNGEYLMTQQMASSNTLSSRASSCHSL